MKNKAFTLIELLVVIVIIGILATISTATFSSAREKAEFAKAISSWQQVNSVMAQYVEDMYLRLEFEEGSGTTTRDSSGKGNNFTVGNASLWSTETPIGNSNYSLASRPGSTSYTSLYRPSKYTI